MAGPPAHSDAALGMLLVRLLQVDAETFLEVAKPLAASFRRKDWEHGLRAPTRSDSDPVEH